jgi:hypothetical protein
MLMMGNPLCEWQGVNSIPVGQERLFPRQGQTDETSRGNLIEK